MTIEHVREFLTALDDKRARVRVLLQLHEGAITRQELAELERVGAEVFKMNQQCESLLRGLVTAHDATAQEVQRA